MLQIMHLLVTAAMSKDHVNSIFDSLQAMSKNNTLTQERLLIIITYADHIALHPNALSNSKHARQQKRTRKIFHGMVLISILQAFAMYGPFPDIPKNLQVITDHEHLSQCLKTHDESWFQVLQDCEQTDDEPPTFIKWSCTMDIFLPFMSPTSMTYLICPGSLPKKTTSWLSSPSILERTQKSLQRTSFYLSPLLSQTNKMRQLSFLWT